MEAPPVIAVLRALHVAAMLSLLGTQACTIVIVRAAPDRLGRTLRRTALASGVLALLAGAAWLVLEAGAIAGATTFADLRDALPVVAAHTRFGRIVTVRLLLLLLATAAWQRPVLSLIPAAAAACLQGLIGHAGAGRGAPLLVSEALHLLAAGLWLGALLPLWLSIRGLPARPAARACQRFTPLGLGCVLVLAGTGLAQGLSLIGGMRGVLFSTYGHIALLKAALFLFALVLAACNRLWLTDRMAAETSAARRHLLASVAAETAIGLAIITAAAFLASSMPGAEQASLTHTTHHTARTIGPADPATGGLS
ncbi:MAG TPA: CopD family protein [Rhodopila sp.]|nr:CopD family protein [Rhodopila sp.]